ncbi:MAG: hypothetical protein CSA72_07280 [Rhodobacterales bacterium]|nr:MAG: hypothetical protein CSA72_07280 [Rhodobacterales bacterium]
MMTITYTAEQAAAIVAKWNDLANAESQLDAAQAHLVISGDNFDDEIESQGYATIEVPARQSKSGNPATFIIDENELTIE